MASVPKKPLLGLLSELYKKKKSAKSPENYCHIQLGYHSVLYLFIHLVEFVTFTCEHFHISLDL